MYCTSCGAQMSDDAKFCTSCGAALRADVPAEPQPEAVSQPTSTDDIFASYQPPVAPEPELEPYASPAASQPAYVQPTYAQPTYSQPTYVQPTYQEATAGALYPMTDTDRTLRLISFIFCIVCLIACGWAIIPLAWMIPMSVRAWGIYKGTKPNTVGFDICMLIFFSLVSGILLLCSHKDN
ncbi:MAG: zinc-ribbon domain-containing protein [Eggerthellaceae bacterium]